MSFPVPPVYCPQIKSKRKSQVYHQRIACLSTKYHMRHKHFLQLRVPKSQCNPCEIIGCPLRCSHAWRVTLKAKFKGHQPTVATMKHATLWNKSLATTSICNEGVIAKEQMKKYFTKPWIRWNQRHLPIHCTSHQGSNIFAPLLRSSWRWWQSWKWRRTCASHIHKSGKPVNQPNNTNNKNRPPKKLDKEKHQPKHWSSQWRRNGETKMALSKWSRPRLSEHFLRQIVPLNTRMQRYPQSNVFQSAMPWYWHERHPFFFFLVSVICASVSWACLYVMPIAISSATVVMTSAALFQKKRSSWRLLFAHEFFLCNCTILTY